MKAYSHRNDIIRRNAIRAMRTNITILFLCIIASVTSQARQYDMSLKIDLLSHKADIPQSLYGVFFEEINHAGEGGLYGEMLQNRSFEDKTLPEGYSVGDDGRLWSYEARNYGTGRMHKGNYNWSNLPYPGWHVSGSQSQYSASIMTEAPNFVTAPSYLHLDIKESAEPLSLCNEGFWGIRYERGKTYRLRIWLRAKGISGQKSLEARLCSSNDNAAIVGSANIKLTDDGAWHEYNIEITAQSDATSGTFSMTLPGKGTYDFDYVSLFPKDTYHGRPNGMRRDVAEMVEALHPAFVRWPGGCEVEGISLNNRFEWRKTLGDPAARPGVFDGWGYRNSYGFGYKEFLDFCEDLGAKAMFVCNVGMSCIGRTGEYSAEGDIQLYIQEALDAIEYAIGDTTTVWGGYRAREGHPAPYPLAYIEIGNENFGPIYEHRYNLFYDAIKKRYPELTLISNDGMQPSQEAQHIDMVDPHWYEKPDGFFGNPTRFDNYDRNGPKIYVGEYACNNGVGTGNMFAALSEAAFLTTVERNADVVKMASYAPLFEHEHDRAWPVNLIWISSDKVMGRSSYYVQQLFSKHRFSYNLATKAMIKPETKREAFLLEPGYFALGNFGGEAAYRNVHMIRNRHDMQLPDVTDSCQWTTMHNNLRTYYLWHGDKLKGGDVIEFEMKPGKDGGDEMMRFIFDLNDIDVNQSARMLCIGQRNDNSVSLKGFYGDNSVWNILDGKADEQLSAEEWHKVRVEMHEDGICCVVDGKEVLSFQTNIINRKFYSAGYDEETGEVVIKLVNANERKCTAHIELNGSQIERNGRVIQLRSASPLDENDFSNPKRIYPEERPFNRFSSSFDYIMPSNSVTILRTKCRK